VVPWHLDDERFRKWAMRKMARDALVEEKERFAEANPPEKLVHIYKVLDEKVFPILTEAGISISREECHGMFLRWFVVQASPEVKHLEESPDDEALPPVLIIQRQYDYCLTMVLSPVWSNWNLTASVITQDSGCLFSPPL